MMRILEDKFGDNGVVSIIIGHMDSDTVDIALWLMSCRVLKRNMEYAMMDRLVEECWKRGMKKIIGHYYPTAKNGIVREFYGTMGFEKVEEDDRGNSKWTMTIDGYEKKNKVISAG